jgi:Bacteriophage Mu, Gp27
MPVSPKSMVQPAELRKEMDRRLVDGSFPDYARLAKWLRERGYAISPRGSASHRQRFEQRLEQVKLATDQARTIVETTPDDSNQINEALQRLIQQRLFEILVAVEGKDIKDLNLGALARTVAELGRAWVTQKKWLEETRVKVAQKVTAAGAKVSEVARSAGLTPETEDRIRRALLEIQV